MLQFLIAQLHTDMYYRLYTGEKSTVQFFVSHLDGLVVARVVVRIDVGDPVIEQRTQIDPNATWSQHLRNRLDVRADHRGSVEEETGHDAVPSIVVVFVVVDLGEGSGSHRELRVGELGLLIYITITRDEPKDYRGRKIKNGSYH